jgi:hypothetical protein
MSTKKSLAISNSKVRKLVNQLVLEGKGTIAAIRQAATDLGITYSQCYYAYYKRNKRSTTAKSSGKASKKAIVKTNQVVESSDKHMKFTFPMDNVSNISIADGHLIISVR